MSRGEHSTMDWQAYKKDLKAQSRLYQRRLRSLKASRDDRRILEAVISTDDLPDGVWTRFKKQAYRRVATDPGQSEDVRAADLGLIAARVSFENVLENRSIGITLIPFASNADANAVLTKLAEKMSVRPFKAQMVHLEELSKPPVPELEGYRVLEAVYSSVSARDQGRIAGCVVDTHLVSMSFSGERDSWPWEQVAGIADLQRQKLRRWLAQSS
jgi:hypothetical protein